MRGGKKQGDGEKSDDKQSDGNIFSGKRKWRQKKESVIKIGIVRILYL